MLTEVLISKAALLKNLRAYRDRVRRPVMAVVKSEAYGHGLVETAKVLQPAADWFGVVSGAEALRLRQAGIRKPILVLSFYEDSQVPELIRRRVSLAVYAISQARQISAIGKRLSQTAQVHLKIDTGTSRLGVLPPAFGLLADTVIKLPGIKIEGVFSHLAASEENSAFTAQQNEVFEEATRQLAARGISAIKHIACTAAGVAAAATRHDMVRLGLGLYGLWPSEKIRRQAGFRLLPALQWQTRIIQIKDLPKGANVGYGLSFRTKRRTKLAVLPIGYFDGYDRKLSNSGAVAVRQRRCPILGRVCMNLTMIDVSGVAKVAVGDPVELIGPTITADELARKIGTINYEVVSRINPLIPRRII
jgi:alanine racemase